jgi:hypothetical protein
MHDHGTPSATGVQRAVLSLVLDAHPDPLAILAIASEIDQGDAGERAIRELVGVGLLECDGKAIWPTRAAIHFEQLELS